MSVHSRFSSSRLELEKNITALIRCNRIKDGSCLRWFVLSCFNADIILMTRSRCLSPAIFIRHPCRHKEQRNFYKIKTKGLSLITNAFKSSL